nr:MAG: hypothetical protein [Marnaviridae sp.]
MWLPNKLGLSSPLVLNGQQEMITKFAETSLTLIYDFKRSQSKLDLIVAMGSFYRSMMDQSVIGGALTTFTLLSATLEEFLPTLQASSGWWETLEDFHSNLHRVRGSALGKKLKKVFNHLFAHVIYTKLGLEFDSELFSKIEKKVIRPTVWNALTFIDAIASLVFFLVRQGRQALLTGNIDCMFVDGGSATKFLNDAAALRKDFEFLGNPEAVGIKVPLYLKNLADTICQGEWIKKVLDDQLQKRLVESMLLELKTMERRYISTSKACAQRWAPVSVVLYGDAGVGKTFILQGLFQFYCNMREYSKEDSVLYQRNFEDKYWSGYKSWMCGVWFDDVAKYVPTKLPSVDPSLSELISVINNAAYVTNQADACDKGKIPFMSEWVGVTSNIADLNIQYNYTNTYAVMRRLPLRITPIVKEEFRVPGTSKLDSAKVPAGQYPDCWIFTIAVAHQVSDQHGVYKDVATLNSYKHLLEYLRKYYQKHIDSQKRYMNAVANLSTSTLCECGVPSEMCMCNEIAAVQAGKYRHYDHDEKLDIEVVDASLTQHQLELKKYKSRRVRETRSTLKGPRLTYFNIKTMRCQSIWKHSYTKASFDAYLCNLFREIADLEDMSDEDLVDMLEDFSLDYLEDDAWVDFSPEIGSPRYFGLGNVQQMYNKLLKWITDPTESQKKCIKAYVYDQVPILCKAGWSDKSLVAGMFSYMRAYGSTFDDKIHEQAIKLFDLTETCGWRDWALKKIVILYFDYSWFRCSANALMGNGRGKRLVHWFFEDRPHAAKALIIGNAAAYDRKLKGDHPFVLIIRAVMAAGLLIAAFKAIKWVFAKDETRKITVLKNVPIEVAAECPNVDYCVAKKCEQLSKCHAEPVNSETQTDLETDMQMVKALRDIGREPIKREGDKVNKWILPDRDITQLDFSPKRANSLTQLQKKLNYNTLYVELFFDSDERPYKVPTNVLVVDETTLLINNHSIEGPCRMVVYLGSAQGRHIHPTVEVNVSEKMMTRHQERDLCIIRTSALPGLFKDIRDNLPKRTFKGNYDGFYMMKRSDGSTDILPGCGAQRVRDVLNGYGIDVEAILVKTERPTRAGDCGSIFVMETGYGPVIAGIHYAWTPLFQGALITPIYYEDFKSVSPMVQCGVISVPQTTEETKLYTDYYEEGTLMVHGGLTGFRPRMKATGGKTEVAEFIFSRAESYGIEAEDKMHRPVMSGWEPQQVALKEYIKPTHSIDEALFSECVDEFFDYVTSNLTEEDKADIHPVNIDYAVCGAPGIPNMDAQKSSTSGGFSFPGPKRGYMEFLGQVEGWQDYKRYTHEVEEKINEMWENYKQGIRCHPVASAQLKNEMVSLKKLLAKKTRVFFMCELSFLTLMRTQTLGLSRVMVRRRDLFKTAVGLNTHSEEWHALWEKVSEKGMSQWIAGDFVGFDKILSLLISNKTSEFFVRICEWSGNFESHELLALKTMLADVVNPTIDYFGTLITLLGGEISGHQMTTFFNSAANVLLHMYAFKKIEPTRNFFDDVEIRTLGDDVFMNISESLKTYNHTSIQKEFASIGIQYTMAEKDAASVPFISAHEVTFLKRTFRDHSAFPYKVAPLEKASIVKMLCYTIPSKDVSPSTQLAQAMNAALMEAFYHDKEYFQAIEKIIQDAPKSRELMHAIEMVSLPTWEDLVNRFISASPSMGLPPSPNQKEARSTSYCTPDSSLLQNGVSVECVEKPASGRPSQVSIQRRARQVSQKTDTEVISEPRRYPDNPWFTKNYKKVEDDYTHIPSIPERYLDTHTSQRIQALTNLRNKMRRRWKVDAWDSTEFEESRLQSDKVYETPDTEGKVDVSHQQMTFANEPEGASLNFGAARNPVATRSKLPQELGEYLNRPLKIFDYQWAENGADGLKTTFKPWSAYFGNANIQKKMFGFSLVRANLKLKFLINGSPFYYGSLWTCYTPLIGRTDTATSSISNVALVAVSQKPGVWLNPQTLSTAEMKVPFLWPYPYIDIQSITSLDNMGKVDLWQFAPLLSANGTNAQNLDIAVYAWLEDIELSGPSDQAILQSQKEYQSDTQISEMASTVAEVAGALSFVPGIGPYAMATAELATTAGAVAGALGYTNVPNVSDVAPMKIMPFQLASSSISEPVNKLSLQPKQETCLGSSQFGGCEEDELAVSHFVQRESYMTAVDWPVSGATAPIGSSLFAFAVSPLSFTRYTTTVPNEVAHTPMSYLSQMFQWWRGDIIIRVKVIKSKYHRGRLALSWDRAANDLSEGATLGNPNTLTVIADLDETDEVEMRIPYMQQQQFLSTYAALTIPSSDPFSTSATPSGSWSRVNGVFNIRVMNRLSAPEPTSTVRLQIFVRGAENLEFAGPLDWSTITTTDITGPSRNLTSVVQSEKVYDLDVGSTDTGDVYKEVFGEKIVSLRELLHRSSVGITVPFTNFAPAAAGTVEVVIPTKRLPPPTGCYNNAWSSATVNGTAGQLVNFSKFHPLWVISMCFIGFKGSTNVTVNYEGTERVYTTLGISRLQQGASLVNQLRRPNITTVAASSTVGIKARNYALYDSGAAGAAITNTRTNTGMVANLPFYSASGFHVVDPDGYYNNQDDVTTANDDWWAIRARCTTSATTDFDNTFATVYYSSGPDFNTVFFINVPILVRTPVVAT